MAISRYDSDGDGRCDAGACRAVPMVVSPRHAVEYEVARQLRWIGIRFDLTIVPDAASGRTYGAPASRVAWMGSVPWYADYPNGSTFFVPFFNGASIAERWSLNIALLGATPEQLDAWGYRVRTVPSADDRIARCIITSGRAQTRCWAELDQYLMTEVVSWLPYMSVDHAQVVSERVVGYSFDQFDALPALDRIALQQGSD